jgi:hypothetical protein
VAVGTNTAQKELDATSLLDLLFVCLAFGLQIGRISV